MSVLYCVVFILTVNLHAIVSEPCSSEIRTRNCKCSRLTNEESFRPELKADCSSSDLTVFPDKSDFVREIQVLDLSFNKIASLTNQSFEFLTNIKLCYNEIATINADFFKGLKRLEHLDLSYNNVTSLSSALFKDLGNLKTLDLSFNNIAAFPDNFFQSLGSLKYLDISYNPMGEYLMASNDVLIETLGLNMNLTHLMMNNVGLKALPRAYFDKYSSLTSVCLADNNFEDIPILPTSLEYLDMSGNNMTYLSLHYLGYPSLKKLKLQRLARLETIDHYAFNQLDSIEEISIVDCPNLREFSDLAFSDLKKEIVTPIKRLILSRNGIEKLNNSYHLLFHKLDHIELGDNPWNCDCEMIWLKDVTDIIHDSSEIRCSKPRNLKNKRLLELTDADHEHCFSSYGKRTHRILIPILIVAIILLLMLVVYVIYYAPILKIGRGNITIGPTSPYSPAPTM